jgi:glutaredoxin 3
MDEARSPFERALLGSNEMPKIQVYTTRWCGYCVRAKMLLEGRGLPYEEISLDHDPHFREQLNELTGGWTVPQIVIDGRPIGGYTELWHLDRSGALEQLAA